MLRSLGRLRHLEEDRRCAAATRNQRLGALHTLIHRSEQPGARRLVRSDLPHSFQEDRAPEHNLPGKARDGGAPGNTRSPHGTGPRDYVLKLFLYNSGAQASEAAELKIRDVDLHAQSVRILGKGNKQRTCPLWPTTLVPCPGLTG